MENTDQKLSEKRKRAPVCSTIKKREFKKYNNFRNKYFLLESDFGKAELNHHEKNK